MKLMRRDSLAKMLVEVVTISMSTFIEELVLIFAERKQP